MSSVAPAAARRRHEVADILRDHAHGLTLTRAQARAVRDIIACRTIGLGGHVEVCPDCGFSRPAYNSCRNRHCPKCQVLKQELWAEAQEALLLPSVYFQIVFTIPRELHRLVKCAPKVCFALLFDAVAETLTQVAKRRLKATIGFTAVLHTWNQKLGFHPHVHCVVPGGGLSFDKTRWVATSKRFFLPVKALRTVFRAKLLAKLEAAIRTGEVPGLLTQNLGLIRNTPKTWKVYAKAPLAGPGHVVRYLSRYVHRIAIANSRILDYDGQNVTFRYKDRAAGTIATRTVGGAHFARLFLQHVLPPRFVRIRHYGFLSPRCRKDLDRCRQLIAARPTATREKDASWVAAFQRLFGTNPLTCPACKTGVMVVRDVVPSMRR